jgi:hypothetical protein
VETLWIRPEGAATNQPRATPARGRSRAAEPNQAQLFTVLKRVALRSGKGDMTNTGVRQVRDSRHRRMSREVAKTRRMKGANKALRSPNRGE